MKTLTSGPLNSATNLVELMKEAVQLEKEFIRDCLPVSSVGLSADEFCTYIDYIADRRLNGVGLEILTQGWKTHSHGLRK
jgi:ribonucleoside-diphosphate reductase beta chain